MKNISNYVRAKSLEEAYELNQKKTNCIVGGMLWLKMERGNVNTAIDLCNLGLDTIEETEEQFSIGAMVTLRDMEKHAGLEKYTGGAVRKAMQDIVGVQFRNLATVGGSIWRRFGFSDVLTVFLAMDTYVELYHAGVVSLEEFSKMKYDRDLVVRIIVKKTPLRMTYLSMRNTRTDFPVLTCAAAERDGEYLVSIGARPGRARIVRDEHKILAEGITETSAATFAAYAARQIPTGSNLRGSAKYRTHLAKVLTARGLAELAKEEA